MEAEETEKGENRRARVRQLMARGERGGRDNEEDEEYRHNSRSNIASRG